jgi:hypothetical protein
MVAQDLLYDMCSSLPLRCVDADRCVCATTSALVAWLDAAATHASAPVGHPRRQRSAQLLGRLLEGRMLRPLAYVDWLVAHGVVAEASPAGAAVSSRAAWHRSVLLAADGACGRQLGNSYKALDILRFELLIILTKLTLVSQHATTADKSSELQKRSSP